MPKKKSKNRDRDEDVIEEEWDPVKELKKLNLEDFLNCDDTREILISEHYYNFEKKLKYKLADLYSNFNLSFRDENLFGKDWDNELGESFAELIYNFISINYDINLFYDCPALAIELLSKKNK
tara:strand:- start:670 stop:1038 length:369 start_codon:yes stop_codon:yes gene_type:complete